MDKISITAIIISALLNSLLGYSMINLLLAAFIISGFFLVQFLISRGKWIGGGDIRLGFLMGVILGWPHGIVALFIAYFLGSIIGILLIIWGKKKFSSKIPFGTFLTAGTFIALLYGQEIIQWYLKII